MTTALIATIQLCSLSIASHIHRGYQHGYTSYVEKLLHAVGGFFSSDFT